MNKKNQTNKQSKKYSSDPKRPDSKSAATSDANQNKQKDKKRKKASASLDEMLEQSIAEYNQAYAEMNDLGKDLHAQRERSIDVIQNVEDLINSIANHPKTFDRDIGETVISRKNFMDQCAFAKLELDNAKKTALSAGAGVAGGAAVAAIAPSAAMWVATTFGTASTGTAISALSGAAAQSAALAWLGGGALAAGGGGMAAGNALLALAGPVGWSVAGISLCTSVALFANKKLKLNKEKKEAIESIKHNTLLVKIIREKIRHTLGETESLRESVFDTYRYCVQFFNQDFMSLTEEDKIRLGTLVNETKALALSISKEVGSSGR